MIGPIVRLLGTIGVPENCRRIIAEIVLTGVIVVVLWIVLGVWLSRHDRRVVAADRSAGDVAVLNTTLAADRAAGAAKDRRDRDFGNDQRDLQEKADAAADNGASPLDVLFGELH